MARSRNLKPGFFTNDSLAEIEPLGRLLFQGLWCLADREGRLEDRPKRIKAEVLPYDNCDADDLLDVLARKGFILRYVIDGKGFISVINFSKHQNPHVKESASSIPAPDEHSASTVQSEEKPEQAGLIPDSLKPITDSLVHKALSGKPDGVREVLDFLNVSTKSGYKPVSANLDKIAARLNEGATVDEMKQVIARKSSEWLGTDMEKYLRPETLFNATKYNQYVGQLGKPIVNAKSGVNRHGNFGQQDYRAGVGADGSF